MRGTQRFFSLGTTIFLLAMFVLPERALAIPAFSRKYGTSCATCHVGFPKLTPFGEAFRMGGFIWPDFGEEDNTKETPVSLGAKSYKRVWPKAIWPADIPATAPISFRVRQTLSIVSEDGKAYTEFSQPALQMMAGGTIGEDISFYAGAHLFEEGKAGSLDRIYLKLDNMLDNTLPHNALNLRIGQFVPEIVPFISNHRSLTLTAYAFNTYAPSQGSSFGVGHAHGSGPFGIEQFQLGLEVSGVLKSRLRYVIGLLNGNGVADDNNSAKDAFFRLAYKRGGLAYDGTSEGVIYDDRGNNWSEKSMSLGVFGYYGTGVSENNDVSIIRLGADINISYRDFNLFGGFITGTDEEYHSGELLEESYNLMFSEINYMFYPWLVGVVRYEQANPEDMDAVKRIVPHITALYTANVKFILEAPIVLGDTDNLHIQVGMDFAF